ncbi:hypothetical protein GQ473_03155 [archaeon]|nr:hypothetical protein [archaeon]
MTYEDELYNYYIPGKSYKDSHGEILEFSCFVYDCYCTGCESELGICPGYMLKFTNGKKYCPSENGHRRFIKIETSNTDDNMTYEDELYNYYIPGKSYKNSNHGILEFSCFVYDCYCKGCESELGTCPGYMLKFTNGKKYCPSENGHRRFVKVKTSNIR